MADGRVHTQIALGLALPITGGAVLIWNVQPHLAAGLAIGGVVGVLLTPDIDHEMATIEERRMERIPIWGWLWRWAWTGYAISFEHRGVSHALIVGTATRALFAFVLANVLRYLVNGLYADLCAAGVMVCGESPIPPITNYIHAFPWFWLGLFWGWVIQDAGHILVDYIGLRALGGMALLVLVCAVVWLIFSFS